MYLDTDSVLALVKESDWLKTDVEMRIKGEKTLCTSVMTVVECRLVLIREEGRDVSHSVEKVLKKTKIQLLPLNEKILEKSRELSIKYDFLGVFDALHAATSIVENETMLSTDHVFALIDEVKVTDPREG